MKPKIKTLKPQELLEKHMSFGEKRKHIFKPGYETFYIARMKDLTEISKIPVPPVKAKTHTLFFLEHGILIMKIGSYSIRIKQNECIIIPAGQVFSYSEDDDKNIEEGNGFICGFHDDFLIEQLGNRDLLKSFEFLTIWGNPIIKPKEESVVYILNSLNRIMSEYDKGGLENKLIIQAYLITVLCELNKDYKPLSNHNNKRAVELTNQFKELLHQKVNTIHKVSDYAKMLNISPNHLNKSIKLITRKSPSIWIRTTLVNEAKVLLLQTDLTIQQIVLELGIDDQSYFARLFKKQEGISPNDYRHRIDLS